ncbi:hypothetical protein [Porphyromonas loveana]|uniref:Uncharacterized protein n=1 Tax=Porphyromonas loveana TaxID=1884669 RepID=A0A2U1FMH8_9PORP|nr:hypothetical protein [Porphyromonas loveana]PVZ13405.1 hypothetical protein C7382_103101 [Porphyromonas loveana]
MAVTKIRKVSSWTLISIVVISVIVVLAFFFGGSHVEGERTIYHQTGLLLTWSYILFGAAVLAALFFSFGSFAKGFKNNPKKAMMSLASFILLAVVLLIGYAAGSEEAMTSLNADSARYNTPGWLKVTDMWLYTIYTLGTLVILATVWGAARKSLKR